jgi:hypothetical protein
MAANWRHWISAAMLASVATVFMLRAVRDRGASLRLSRRARPPQAYPATTGVSIPDDGCDDRKALKAARGLFVR